MTMRAMAFTEYGGPDVLRPLELDVPEPGPGQVRVRVGAAGVMPSDTGVRQGAMRPPGTAFPIVPGNEFAGTRCSWTPRRPSPSGRRRLRRACCTRR
ncbi:alcohol dehydrogenase catalytic domain-containing protein [Streptomyces sp. NRRL B-1347]|uniref:alcohol dehydrogenase catalytic domain-containing protein n=1 Tax=Streptomyces sp. NRRL B-1347 TaxID=1476877 RepID=UPI00131B7149|nr:alcohol dehydrogenase catalytic domain-containing protein [Streptomyces sp. NRRL B-1347]